jgi:translation elongation factor EF-4
MGELHLEILVDRMKREFKVEAVMLVLLKLLIEKQLKILLKMLNINILNKLEVDDNLVM